MSKFCLSLRPFPWQQRKSFTPIVISRIVISRAMNETTKYIHVFLYWPRDSEPDAAEGSRTQCEEQEPVQRSIGKIYK